MSSTPRELVYQTLQFECPVRPVRELWTLPVATALYPNEAAALAVDFPSDFVRAPGFEREQAFTKGDPYEVGEYIDPWGCIFHNIHPGVIGEVKNPIVTDWTDVSRVRIPLEMLTLDIDAVNRFCSAHEHLFSLSSFFARPFEQLQFIRGTAELYMDLLDEDPQLQAFLKEIHGFYCEVYQRWVQTDVDAIFFMDDWGSQRNLLIAPDLWRAYFKPLYAEYAQIAHNAGKKVFMHSDGNILQIYPDLIEIGIDAVNSQIFCIGLENLRPFAGRITFWGEMDRQHLLVEGTLTDIDQAVRDVFDTLWADGGCIAQCEFGPGCKPENVRQMFESWDDVLAVRAS